MNKYIFVLALFIFVSNALLAKRVKGFFITQNNDTANVNFNIPIDLLTGEPNMEILQWKIKYFDANNKKQTLKPSQAKEVFFTIDSKEVRMVSKLNNLGFIGSLFGDNSFIFLKIIVDGKMKLYNYYFSQGLPGRYDATKGITTVCTSYSAELFILQKDTAGLFKISWLSFKKDMIDYLSDCPELAKKVEGKTYRRNDMELIVNEYNRECTVH